MDTIQLPRASLELTFALLTYAVAISMTHRTIQTTRIPFWVQPHITAVAAWNMELIQYAIAVLGFISTFSWLERIVVAYRHHAVTGSDAAMITITASAGNAALYAVAIHLVDWLDAYINNCLWARCTLRPFMITRFYLQSGDVQTHAKSGPGRTRAASAPPVLSRVQTKDRNAKPLGSATARHVELESTEIRARRATLGHDQEQPAEAEDSVGEGPGMLDSASSQSSRSEVAPSQ